MNYNSEDTDQKIKYHTYFSMDQQGQNRKNFDIEKKDTNKAYNNNLDMRRVE